VLANRPVVTVQLNGRLLERFTPSDPAFAREYRVVPAPGEAENILELSTDRTAWDPGTGRDRGLRLQSLSWGPG
jgi:hypothetical protein